MRAPGVRGAARGAARAARRGGCGGAAAGGRTRPVVAEAAVGAIGRGRASSGRDRASACKIGASAGRARGEIVRGRTLSSSSSSSAFCCCASSSSSCCCCSSLTRRCLPFSWLLPPSYLHARTHARWRLGGSGVAWRRKRRRKRWRRWRGRGGAAVGEVSSWDRFVGGEGISVLLAVEAELHPQLLVHHLGGARARGRACLGWGAGWGSGWE